MTVLRRYIQAADIDLSSQLLLFRPLTKRKLGYTLGNGKSPYTHCEEIFKDVGYDPKDYGLHSLRSGGVTSVVSKLHGRWKSDEAKDMYELEPQCSRLRVTKYLGILFIVHYIVLLKCIFKKGNKSVRVRMRSTHTSLYLVLRIFK